MNLSQFNLTHLSGYRPWLEDKIRQLSVAALSENAITCTACGEVLGAYIIEYGGKTFRLSAEETLALLQFVATD
jgi:hypothetical protein